MRPVPVLDDKAPFFSECWAIYEESFPLSERRSLAKQQKLFADSRFHLDAWLAGEKFVGMMSWWDFGHYRYVEHLAIDAKKRSGGYGKRLVETFLHMADTPVLLEIEDPVDALTRRRLGFYRRLGFQENAERHIQPPYQYEADGSGEDVVLQVLSWPSALAPDDQAAFVRTLRGIVWADLG